MNLFCLRCEAERIADISNAVLEMMENEEGRPSVYSSAFRFIADLISVHAAKLEELDNSARKQVKP